MEKKNLDFTIEKSKDGYNIAKIKKDNKYIYIGSKYNVRSELDKFLNYIDTLDGIEDNEKQFIIFGFGAGEHIKELRKKYKKNKIKVIEPNKAIGEYIENLEWIKKDENIELVDCYKSDDIEDLDDDFFDECKLQNIQIIPFANYKKLYLEEFLCLCKEIRKIYVDNIIQRNTKMYFKDRWFEALMENIPHMIESPILDLYKNEYKNKPAIIVSSGPSLDKNIENLIGIEGEFFIISAGRSLVALKEKKINANLFVSIDSDELSYKFIEDFIEDIEAPLLFLDTTNEKIVKNYNGKKICSTYNKMMYDIFSEYIHVQLLTSYGSVSHTMISAAVLLGCNPIILVGQDCAYTNNKAHSPFLEEKQKGAKFEDSKRENDFFVEDVNGGQVRTSWELDGFRIGIEKLIKDNQNITFINATEGGAKIHGAMQMKLCDAINKYSGSKVEALSNKISDNRIKLRTIDVISEMQKGLLYIKNKCNEALILIKKISYNNFNYSKKNNDIINKINEIDKKIKKEMSNFIVIESLLYPIIYNILVDKSVVKEKDEIIKRELIIEENLKLYTNIKNVIEYSLKYLEHTLDALKSSERIFLSNKKEIEK